MFPKPFRNFSRGDGMDEYLLSLGLWRKTIPKDESCLYRAVADQVFSTQTLHEQVMKACQSYIERHREEMSDDWLGPVEIKAMSLIYKRDFIIYKQPGKEPTIITNFGFNDQVVLCFSGSNHYDSVYTRAFMENSALCQSVLYELLYESVFGVENATRKGQDMISTKPSHVIKQNIISMVQDKLTHPCCATCEPSASACLMHEKPNYHSTPFPYKVAKSLSVEVFQNVEYDAWLEGKKEEQSLAYQDHLNAQSGSANFTPGDKCQLMDVERSRSTLKEINAQGSNQKVESLKRAWSESNDYGNENAVSSTSLSKRLKKDLNQVYVVTRGEILAYFKLLEDPFIHKFLRFDPCLLYSDKYLLAMVFAYFKRANFTEKDYSKLNFFLALFLANDMEEDEEDLKFEILPWAFGKGWMFIKPIFLRERYLLLERMSYRAVVSRESCEEVMNMEPSHWAWLRERAAHHTGVTRSYTRDVGFYKLRGPHESPRRLCDECKMLKKRRQFVDSFIKQRRAVCRRRCWNRRQRCQVQLERSEANVEG